MNGKKDRIDLVNEISNKITYEKPAAVGFPFIQSREKRIGQNVSGIDGSIASCSVNISLSGAPGNEQEIHDE